MSRYWIEAPDDDGYTAINIDTDRVVAFYEALDFIADYPEAKVDSKFYREAGDLILDYYSLYGDFRKHDNTD